MSQCSRGIGNLNSKPQCTCDIYILKRLHGHRALLSSLLVMVAYVKPSLVPPTHALLPQSVHVQGHHEPILKDLRFYSLHLPQKPKHVSFTACGILFFYFFYLGIFSVNIRKYFLALRWARFISSISYRIMEAFKV